MIDKFSVLMSLYNKEKSEYLELCFQSLANQTVLANEIVLVLDGPINDKLDEIVENWIDKLPIKTISLENNVGLATALNIGLKQCSFELVARMDTDDICHFQRFEQQLHVMNDKWNDIDICGTLAINIDEKGNEITRRVVPKHHDDIKKYIWSCPIIHPSVMFKKSKIIEIGSYNVNAPYRQDDYELWIRCINNGLRFYNIPNYLIYYRYPLGAECKNGFMVGFNRFRLGFSAAMKYNPGITAILGLCYPMIRVILPTTIRMKFIHFISQYDPRNKS